MNQDTQPEGGPTQLISSADFEWIFEATPFPLLLMDPALTVMAANDAYLEATHRTRESLIGKSLFATFPPTAEAYGPDDRDALGRSLQRVIEYHLTDTLPVRSYAITDADHPELPPQKHQWSLHHAPLMDVDGELNYIIQRIEDFTDILRTRGEFPLIKASQAELRTLILRLERELAARGQARLKMDGRNTTQQQQEQANAEDFFSHLGNELRTPLNLILAPIEELLQADIPLNTWQRSEIQTARHNALYLRKMINLLQDFSRARAGFADALFEPVDLAACTREIAALFRPLIERGGLGFRVNCEYLPEPIYVDPGLWESIVLNLLSNALKFTLEGQIEVVLKSWEKKGVELTVTDTGCGISRTDQAHLFDSFQHLIPTRARSVEGAGVGLFLVREMVRLHGGRIRVSSAPGQGSTFFIALPAGSEHLPPDRVIHPTHAGIRSHSELYLEEARGWLARQDIPLSVTTDSTILTPSLLLVEASPDMRTYVSRLLGRLYDIRAVEHAGTALTMLAQRPADLIIADTDADPQEGVNLLQSLRKRPETATTPVLILADNATENASIAAMRAGANDYLTKPFTARELFARISSLLNQNETAPQEQPRSKEAEKDRQYLDMVLESIQDNLLVVSPDWHIDLANSRAARTWALSREVLQGQDLRRHGDPQLVEAFQQVLERHQPLHCEYRSDADETWWDLRLFPTHDGRVVILSSDISTRKDDEARQLLVAQHDPLTGLANRTLLLKDGERILSLARRLGHKFALLFIDLDGFKPINDGHGHEIGDKLLHAVAGRIVRTLRAEDLVGRFGGDEFVVLLASITNADDDAAKVAENLRAALRQPYQLDCFDLQVSASVGISTFPRDGDNLDTLIQRADEAMYQAKHMGPDHQAFYKAKSDLNALPLAGKALAGRLREAMESGEFSLVFQPVFTTSTSQLVEVEALIRWRQEDGSYVTPETFLPVAELTGLIKPIGEWLLRTACHQQERWTEQGLPRLSIAVKISGVQFRQKDFEQLVAQVLAETGLQPTQLTLEVAEQTVLGNAEESIRVLRELKQLGVNVAITNFGAGNSNVRALSRFPVDRLKVDRSILRHVQGDQEQKAAADAVIGLGHSLHKEIIAQGIENEADMAYVRDNGCQYSQGYHLAPPMPPGEFSRWWFENMPPADASVTRH